MSRPGRLENGRRLGARTRARFEPIEPRVLLAAVTGTIFEDLNADGIKGTGENGLVGWTVYSDANDNGSLDIFPPVTASNSTTLAINDLTTVTSTISLTGLTAAVAKVTVSVNISHTWNSDLDVYLISPSGTRVELFTDVGTSGDGMIITLDDFVTQSIASASGTPITGTWQPEGSLSTLMGQTGNGDWTLEIRDDAEADFGTLNLWSISVVTSETSVVTAASGNYTLSNLPVGEHKIRQVAQNGWNRTYPAADAHTVNLPTSGSTFTGVNFGNRLPPGQINGFVFADYDKDGVKEIDEPGLSGWTVYIDLNNDSLLDAGEPQTVSAADGSYLFGNIKPGQYIVREVLQSGWEQTSPGSGGVVLLPMESQSISVSRSSTADFSKERIVVAFRGGNGLASLRQMRRNAAIAGMFDLARSTDLLSVDGVSLVNLVLPAGVDPLKAVERFRQISGVAWAQPDYLYADDPRELVPNDSRYGSQYHHSLMKNNLAWDTTLGDPSVIVAITDDGVSLSHPDLSANIWINSDEIAGNGIDDDENGYIDDRNGWDFSSNDSNPNPVGPDDHGTHVAGIVAARTNNAVGVAGTAGGATIMPIRFFGSGAWTSTVIAASFRYAADNGARIVSTSYNIDIFVNDSIFTAGVQYLYDHGVLYLNSAGNNSQINPARQAFDQALFVASTTSTDTKSSFSNYGYGIDISAPGSSIYSTLPSNRYGSYSGTSMAAPNAAGVAALIWSAHPTWTRDQIAAQLIGTADSIDAVNPSYVGLLGGGRVNSYRGVTETIAPPRIRSLSGLPAEGTEAMSMPSMFTLDVANVLDPATVATGSFELRGDGLDNIFGTADDSLISLSLNTIYRIGTNRLSFSIPGAMGSDRYRFSALPSLKDPFGQSLDGNGDGGGGDAFMRTFNLIAMTSPYVMNVASNQTTYGNFGNADTVAPQVLGASFEYQTGHSIQVQFSEDVSSSLSTVNLVLQRVNGTSIVVTPLDEAYDVSTNTATFTFNGSGGGFLADGNYRATLSAAATSDRFQTPLDGDADGIAGGDFSFSFFVLAADADRNRMVNLYDLVMLATHFGQSGMTFSEGDFDYDGKVGPADLAVLALRWQQSLLSPPADSAQKPQSFPPERKPSRTPTRLVTMAAQLLLT